MLDEIGQAHMQQGNFTSFTNDRFGCLNSALNLNGGWTQIPDGIYFNSQAFTISVWVYPRQVGLRARVLDFGSGKPLDNIVLALDFYSDLKPYTQILNRASLFSSKKLALEAWSLLVSTFNGTLLSIYINGTLESSQKISFYALPLVNRTRNYIGKSNANSDVNNLNNDGFSWSYLDDLRLYSKSLNQTEINELMNEPQIDKGK